MNELAKTESVPVPVLEEGEEEGGVSARMIRI
jgi:hypothetical protein